MPRLVPSVSVAGVICALSRLLVMSEHPQGNYEARVSTTVGLSVVVALVVGVAGGAPAGVAAFVATFSVVWFSFMRSK